MNLFLDANVLFAAAYNPRGLCMALFRLAEAGNCQLCSSPFAVDEARRNLARKSEVSPAAADALFGQIVLVPEPASEWLRAAGAVGLPDKDVPILAAAAAANCELLVTGDRRHFGTLYGETVCGVRILTPSEAFDRVVL